jgi:hypothetical protein
MLLHEDVRDTLQKEEHNAYHVPCIDYLGEEIFV